MFWVAFDDWLNSLQDDSSVKTMEPLVSLLSLHCGNSAPRFIPCVFQINSDSIFSNRKWSNFQTKQAELVVNTWEERVKARNQVLWLIKQFEKKNSNNNTE